MIKKLMLLVIFLMLLAGAAVLLAPGLIPPEVVKAQLIERVRDATGRSLAIHGPLSVKLFPFIGVEAEQVTLSNPEGFGTEPFLSVGALQVNVALLPLLKKDIQVDRFVLRDPVIRLAVNRSGRGNWEFRPAQATAAPGDAPAAPQAAPAEAGLKGLRLSAIEIRNGALYYADAAGGKQTLEQLDATLSLRDIAAPLEVAASALWQGRQVKARLTFDSLQTAAAGKPSAFTADVAELLRSIGIRKFKTDSC
jgi:AsmA protein